MSEWKEYRLGDIADIKGGKRLPKGVNLVTTPNNHPYIRIRDFDSNKVLELNNNFEYVDNETQKLISRYIANTDDILLSIVGTIGLVAKVGSSLNNANLTENCVKINNLQVIDSDFLYYYLVSSDGQNKIKLGTVGAVQPKLPIKNISDITIPVPSFETQHSIASFLSALDDKIAVNRRICENLEAQAQALFKHWFIDFGPFKNGKFVESELGMIPEGWRVGTLEELVDIKYGKDHKKLNEGNIPAYGSAGLMRTVDEKLYDGESVLIPRKGTLNNIMYVNEAFWTVDTMFYTIPKKSNILKYLYMKLKRIDFNKMNVGTSIPSNSTSQLNKLKIVVPTDEILSRFDGIMSSLLQEIMHSQKESKSLATLRDTLLPKLMSGQIKV